MLMFVLYFEAAVSEKYFHLILGKTFLLRSVCIIPYCDVINLQYLHFVVVVFLLKSLLFGDDLNKTFFAIVTYMYC